MTRSLSELTVPDLWQLEAVRRLREGRDVVVHAPTGAGKTLIFERFVEGGGGGRCVYTVPTRALANDKLIEWRARGWNIGIETGDLSYRADAPVVVATLETQKRRLIEGRGPDLLVVDEYQMLADPARGPNYEIALAMAPRATRLLLLSGSVGNPRRVVEWLERCGRDAVRVEHRERPVPLDEVSLEALPERRTQTVRGRLPRLVARALEENLAPLLLFVPRRRASEEWARRLAAALPETDPLVLSTEQRAVAGTGLAGCLKRRVAFHHSGLGYRQRAGVIEPLAKAGQLRVVVATAGLAAGINFSVRSVLVLEREYRSADGQHLIRADELLQMYGRAGRRGLDERGAALHIEGSPRLRDARPLTLKRAGTVDWPTLLTVIDTGTGGGRDPVAVTRELTARLFSAEPVRLGLEAFLRGSRREGDPAGARPAEQPLRGGTITEIQNSDGIWERRRAPHRVALADAWMREGERWVPAAAAAAALSSLRVGAPARRDLEGGPVYGREAALARFPDAAEDDRLLLSHWLVKALRQHSRNAGRRPQVPRRWTLEAIEGELVGKLPALTGGGVCRSIEERGGTLYAWLDYRDAPVMAHRAGCGKALLNPLQRRREIPDSAAEAPGGVHAGAAANTIAGQWYRLGLINRQAALTRRGRIFSYFNHGEGLAVAAALEEPNYAIEELVYDLADIRAGRRFEGSGAGGRLLAAACRRAYGHESVPGYLRHGLPPDFGEGAGERLFSARRPKHARRPADDEVSAGDIERARSEWRSLLHHIAAAPALDWDRWTHLQERARQLSDEHRKSPDFDNLPPLTARQRGGRPVAAG